MFLVDVMDASVAILAQIKMSALWTVVVEIITLYRVQTGRI